MRVIKLAQALRLRRDRPKEYLTLEGEKPYGQRMYIYPGVRLIACVQASKDGIYNSMLLVVEGYDQSSIRLGGHTVTHEWAAKHLRRALCFPRARSRR